MEEHELKYKCYHKALYWLGRMEVSNIDLAQGTIACHQPSRAHSGYLFRAKDVVLLTYNTALGAFHGDITTAGSIIEEHETKWVMVSLNGTVIDVDSVPKPVLSGRSNFDNFSEKDFVSYMSYLIANAENSSDMGIIYTYLQHYTKYRIGGVHALSAKARARYVKVLKQVDGITLTIRFEGLSAPRYVYCLHLENEKVGVDYSFRLETDITIR